MEEKEQYGNDQVKHKYFKIVPYYSTSVKNWILFSTGPSTDLSVYTGCSA